MKDEEILKEVAILNHSIKDWKGMSILDLDDWSKTEMDIEQWKKDIRKAIKLSREDEQKKILDLIDSYIKVFPQMFDNPPKDQVIDMIAWNFSIKYLDNFAKELKQKISQLSGRKEMQEKK